VLKGSPVPKAQTMAFATIIFFELFHALNAKSWDESLFSRKFFSNKYILLGLSCAALATIIVIYWSPMQKIFGTVGLSFADWAAVLIVSFSVIFFVEIQKTLVQAEIKEYEKVLIH
jgi:Ca2+-transporting ATPase